MKDLSFWTKANPEAKRLMRLFREEGYYRKTLLLRCWEWGNHEQARLMRTGYGLIRIPSQEDPTRSEAFGANRVYSNYYNGPVWDGFHVCHKCDNPPCVNPAHLFIGTGDCNRRDAVRKKYCIGKGRGSSKWRQIDEYLDEVYEDWLFDPYAGLRIHEIIRCIEKRRVVGVDKFLPRGLDNKLLVRV